MRYERDCWRLQIYHEALASPLAFISHERKQVVIQFLNKRLYMIYVRGYRKGLIKKSDNDICVCYYNSTKYV